MTKRILAMLLTATLIFHSVPWTAVATHLGETGSQESSQNSQPTVDDQQKSVPGDQPVGEGQQENRSSAAVKGDPQSGETAPILQQGTTGSCIWILDGTELTVSGSGEMENYSQYDASPWGSAVETVIIQQGVTKIGEYAFYSCQQLKEVTVAASVKHIGANAFYSCSALQRVTFEEGSLCECIDDSAFEWCEALTELAIPESVVKVGSRAFIACDKLPRNYYDSAKYIGSKDNPYFLLEEAEAYTDAIHLDTKIIGHYAFRYSEVRSITVPEGVTGIMNGAFSECFYLTSITVASSVTYVDADAFYRCNAMQYTYYENGKYLGDKNNPYHILVVGDSSGIIHSNTKVIAGGAFQKVSVTEVTLPDGVVSIGASAFAQCGYLTEITIPDSVQFIGKEAFYSCSKLTDVYIDDLAAWCQIDFEGTAAQPMYMAGNLYLKGEKPEEVVIPGGITEVKPYTFYGWEQLKSVTVSAAVESIDSYAFANCTELSKLTFAAGSQCKVVGNSAFSNTVLETVSLPDGITSIGRYAFGDCIWLSDLTIPRSVKSIGSRAFALTGYTRAMRVRITDIDAWCAIVFGDYLANPLSGGTLYVNGSQLTKLTVSDSVTQLNDSAFYGYTKLTEVSVGKNVKEIGAHAFAECTSLERVVFDGQTSCSEIGDHAFQGCTSLTEITLPGGVRRIGISAFEECTALTKVAFAEGSVCTTIDAYAFRNCENLSEFAMPESVLHIGEYAFYGCGMLTGLALPKDAVSIGMRAFYKCSALQTVTIPKGVTAIEMETFYASGLEQVLFAQGSLCETIGEKAFYECRGLTQIILPKGLTTIGADAFYQCTKLTEVTIPDSVTAIASQAFMNCTQLTTVHISDLAAWCAIDFGDYYANPIYYAKGLYMNGQPITRLDIPQGVAAIGDYAFYNGSSFTALTIADSVKQIGVRAFSGCTGLTEVVVPNSVQGIGASAFADCIKMQAITVPFVGTALGETGSLEAIFRSSNAGISGTSQVPSSLKSVTVTGGNIPASAFRYCRNLTTITLPENAQEIGSYAFQSCSGLSELKIPNSVTKIGSYAFQSCSGLISLEIPESVTSIGSHALSGCSNLQELTVPFVGDTSKAVTDTYQYPFGYIFGTSSYTGGTATKQTYYGRSTTTTTTTTYCIPTALKTVTVNGGNLLYGAFGNCTGITKIIIGSNVKYIDPNAFTGTTALEEFSVSKRNPNYCSSSRILYNKDQSELIWCPDKHTFIFQVTYTYANGQTAFDTIYKRLKAGAAYSAEVPEILGYNARIENISGAMPAEDLFIDVIYYENDVLRKGSCTDTLSWTLYDDGMLIFRGTGEMPDYTAGNASWAEYADNILSVYIDPRVTTIGAYAFENCRNLTFVDYGYSVASIGEYAFAGCSGLTAFKLPESVTTISAGAFSRCTGLKNVVIPDNITSVADDAFLGCDQLVQVTVGGAVTQIGSNAFADCTALTQVYFRGKPAILGSNALGSTGGKFVYYYSNVALWDEAIEDGKWNGYTAVPYNAIARENFNGTNVYIIKVVDRYNSPLVNAVVNLGGEIQSTNADGMAYYLKPTEPQALSVSCSNHITFQDAAFVATDKQIMDIIELSDRPSTVQGVSFNGKSIATSVGVLNCADTGTVKIAVSGYSKYTITKYELHQGDRLLATEKTSANSCTFTLKTSAFEEGQTVLVRMYTADGNMVASALNIDVIKLASVSEKQIMGELSNIDLNVGVGELGDLNFKLPFDGKGDEKLYTMVQGRTIRIGVNLDIKELFEKKETPLSVIQKKVDKAVENFSVVDADVSFKICGYIEIEYLGGGEYYLKTSYVKMSVGMSVSAQAQASLIGIVGVYFKVNLSAEGTLELLITRFTPESGFHLEDLNLSLDVGVGVEGGAYLLWGAGAASVYGNLDMGLTLGIVPKLEIRQVYVTGKLGATWSLLWGLKNGKYVIAEGDIYRWPEEAQSLAKRFLEAQNDPNSYETNDRAYLETRTQWQSGGDYLQKSIYDNVAPEIVTCGDTTLMVWLDDNAQRADNDFQILYYSVYTGSGWSEPVAVDDNGTFDCEFDVCAHNGKIYVIYTEMRKQSRVAAPDIADQSSVEAFVNGVEVKVAVYENGSFGTPVQLTNNAVCELLPRIDSVSGKLTATWLESNAVGLNPDAAATNMRTATLENGIWSESETVAQGQNAVSDVTSVSLEDATYTAYIVDADGDSQTQEDQALILRGEGTVPVQLDTGKITQVDSATVGELSVLTWCKAGKLYMISGAEQTPVCLTPDNIGSASNFRILPLSAQQSLLMFVAGNYDASGNAVDGTDIYSVYINRDGCQSDAVRLTRTEGYVSNYSTVYRGEQLIAVFTETFANVEGDDIQTVTHLRSTALDFYTDLIIDSAQYDVTEAQPNTALPITLRLRNGGTNAIDGITAALYDSTGALVYTAEQAISLPSGAAAECTVTVILPQNISAESYRMELLPQQGTMLAEDTHPDDNREDITLAYADLQVDAEQKIIGQKNYIILTVSNSGNAGSQATLQIYAPNKTGRLLSELETGIIAPGSAQQYMVDMGALVTDADSIVTCVAEAAFMDPFTLNNTDTVALLHVQEDTFVTDPEQIIRNPELSVSTAEFDKFTPADISLQITAEAESFTAIEGLTENTDYTVDNKGVLTVRSSYLSALETGSYGLKLLFDFGYGEPVVRVLTVTVGDSAPVALTGSIAISGNPVVGSTVSADLSNLTPRGAKLTYCWTVEDVPVSTESAYTIQKEDNGKTLVLTVTGDAGYTGSFRVEAAVALRQPAAPSAPVVSQIGSDFFTVAKAAGLEYSLDGTQWQESNRFEGLSPNKTYTVYARVMATDESASGQPSTGTPVTTKKMTVAAPAAPAVAARTHTQITLVADPAMEYMLEGGAWTTDPVFSGLQPETDYVFYQRYKETETAYASPESKATLSTAPFVTLFGNVTGYPDNQEPATVTLLQNGSAISQVVTTDGSYRFTGLVSGSYTLTVTKTGHLPVELPTSLGTADLQQDIRLTPADYTVRFVNEDGTELSSGIYHWGDPVIPPAAPAKAADNTYIYTFAGWDKAVAACTGNATYTATYSASYMDYTVVFLNWNGEVLSSDTYHYGDTVTAPAAPTKAADEIGGYAFAGWDRDVVPCVGNATYTATYVRDRLYAAEVTVDAQIFRYFSLTEAVTAAPENSVIRLLQDAEEAAAFSQAVSVDLNGFDITGEITVAPGVTVSFKDSQTDDYTVQDEAGYGKLTGTVTGVQAAEGYMLITEQDAVSFHRIDLTLTDMTLRPSQAGVYYKSNFAGDELVAQNVARYGVALSVTGIPTEETPGICSWYDNFAPGADANAANGTLLYGVMKGTNTQADNAANAQLPVYGRAYILTTDGRYIFGQCVDRSFRQQVELIDAQWSELTDEQQTALLGLYQNYQAIMDSWNISNVRAAAK